MWIKNVSAPNGERHGHAKLTREKVTEIRSRFLAYVMSYERLARIYGVKASTVRDVVNFRTWRHV